MMDSALFDILANYRYMIWLVGGIATCWLMINLPAWSRTARHGSWVAQRDFALWRVRRAIMALALLVPLLIVTTVASLT